MDIKIRIATNGDERSITNLAKLGTPKFTLSKSAIMIRVELLNYPGYIRKGLFHVAELNGCIVACGLIKGNVIGHLFVDPEFRNRGVGTSLLNHLECIANAKGYATTRLHSLPSNLKYFSKRGYTALGTVEMRKEVTVREMWEIRDF